MLRYPQGKIGFLFIQDKYFVFLSPHNQEEKARKLPLRIERTRQGALRFCCNQNNRLIRHKGLTTQILFTEQKLLFFILANIMHYKFTALKQAQYDKDKS